MRCLVTGGAGFLGSHLTEMLLVHGHEVVVLDDLFRGRFKNLESCEGSPDFHKVKGDARKKEDLEKAIDKIFGVDVIFHLAAINGTRWFHERSDLVIDVNLRSTAAVIDAASRHACRLVFTSSPEAFGTPDSIPTSEGGPSLFSNASEHQRHSYGASKYLGEVMLQHAVRTKDLDARIVRPYNAYGPRCPGNDYGQVVSIFLEKTKYGKPLPMHGEGLQTRSFGWVGDICEGIMLAGTTDRALDDGTSLAGATWNMGWPEETSIKALAEMVQEVTEQKHGIIKVQGYPGDSVRRLPDISAATAQLGWAPHVGLQEGLERTWSAMQWE